MIDGVQMISTERARQKWDEGWTPEHDDEHDGAEMAAAAACYARHAVSGTYQDAEAYQNAPPPDGWPWAAEWWKPKNPQRDLVRAGALCAAEIDRIDRQRVQRHFARGNER